MKKIISVLVIVLVLSLSSCTKDTTTIEDTTSEGTTIAVAKKFKIGIIQESEHPALDAAYEGFMEALKENGLEEGKDLEILYNNAQGDASNLKTISENLVQKNCDLVLAIATPAAVSIKNVTDEIPILFTAVTDPVDAGLVKDNEKPEANVTGTSDYASIREQMELLDKIVPGEKTIGFIYDSGEKNSIIQITEAKAVCDDMGFKYEEATITSTNDIKQVAENITNKVDVLYIPTDNTVASAMPALIQVTNEKKIPVIGGEEKQVENGALISLGISYFKLGHTTGEMAVKILVDGKKPSEIPVEYQKDFKYTINQKTLEILGIKIDEEISKDAEIINEI